MLLIITIIVTKSSCNHTRLSAILQVLYDFFGFFSAYVHNYQSL